MKQFKAEWQPARLEGNPTHTVHSSSKETLTHLLTQHNKLCDFLEERLGEKDIKELGATEKARLDMLSKPWEFDKPITLPKPEWWNDKKVQHLHNHKATYLEALSDASKALGVEIRLEDTH